MSLRWQHTRRIPGVPLSKIKYDPRLCSPRPRRGCPNSCSTIARARPVEAREGGSLNGFTPVATTMYLSRFLNAPVRTGARRRKWPSAPRNYHVAYLDYLLNEGPLVAQAARDVLSSDVRRGDLPTDGQRWQTPCTPHTGPLPPVVLLGWHPGLGSSNSGGSQQAYPRGLRIRL